MSWVMQSVSSRYNCFSSITLEALEMGLEACIALYISAN